MTEQDLLNFYKKYPSTYQTIRFEYSELLSIIRKQEYINALKIKYPNLKNEKIDNDLKLKYNSIINIIKKKLTEEGYNEATICLY